MGKRLDGTIHSRTVAADGSEHIVLSQRLVDADGPDATLILDWQDVDDDTLVKDGHRYAVQVADGSYTDAVCEIHGEDVCFTTDDGDDVQPVRLALIG